MAKKTKLATKKNKQAFELTIRYVAEAGPETTASEVCKYLMQKGVPAHERTVYRWLSRARHELFGQAGPSPALLENLNGAGGGEDGGDGGQDGSSGSQGTPSEVVDRDMVVMNGVEVRRVVTGIDYLGELHASIQRSKRVAEWGSAMVGPDGAKRPRSPKVWYMGERGVQQAVQAAGAIQAQVLDLDKIQKFHQVLFARIQTRDPELVAEILEDIRELAAEWGVDGSTIV